MENKKTKVININNITKKQLLEIFEKEKILLKDNVENFFKEKNELVEKLKQQNDTNTIIIIVQGVLLVSSIIGCVVLSYKLKKSKIVK